MAVPLEAFTSFFANTIKNILPKNVRIFDVLVASLMWCVFTEAAGNTKYLASFGS